MATAHNRFLPAISKSSSVIIRTYLLVVVALGLTIGTHLVPLDASAAHKTAPHRAKPIKTINVNEAEMTVKQSGNCRALTPADWTADSGPQGNAMDMQSGDGALYAGWGIVAIDRAMQPYYGDLYGDPETSMAYLANAILQQRLGDTSGMRYTSAPRNLDQHLTVREFRSAGHRGLVYYRIYPSHGGNYIQSVYFAITPAARWTRDRSLVANITASIRCITQLRPTAGWNPLDGGSNPGSEDDADGLSNSTYNKEIGTEYVHSPNGENYLVDPSTDYVEGPQGYGAYIQNGTDYIKLEPGRVD